jgi:hypothetical protein
MPQDQTPAWSFSAEDDTLPHNPGSAQYEQKAGVAAPLKDRPKRLDINLQRHKRQAQMY